MEVVLAGIGVRASCRPSSARAFLRRFEPLRQRASARRNLRISRSRRLAGPMFGIPSLDERVA